ncbi:hypothetical protein ACQKM9_12165 [Viridibacillus sp. NPDC093762]|uniref:hypothetical protein n=1 Tax=Viridibacillus sp. NPDC093762 TaxID=3390720 RepID=UPI003CFE6092
MKQQLVRRILIATGNSSIGQLGLYQKCGFHMIIGLIIIKKKFLNMAYNVEVG